MIRNRNLLVRGRVTPDLMTPRTVSSELTTQSSELPCQLCIFHAGTRMYDEEGKEALARRVFGKGSPAALIEAIRAEAT